jgi:septal ring factor EnvC (AmiA/AmiB activator)
MNDNQELDEKLSKLVPLIDDKRNIKRIKDEELKIEQNNFSTARGDYETVYTKYGHEKYNNATLHNSIQDLEKIISKTKDEIETTKRNITQHEKEISRNDDEYKEKENKRSLLNKENDELKTEIVKLEKSMIR